MSDERNQYANNADLDLLTSVMSAERLQRLHEVAEQRQKGLLLMMEDVWNPHNLAAITRTVDAFGVQAIYYTADDMVDPEREARKVSRAAGKWLDFTYFPSITGCIEAAQAAGYHVAATVISERAQGLYTVEWAGFDKIAVLVGNEHLGLTRQASEMADVHITIPMYGMSQSLNVSVATAIVLSEITRQREASSRNFRYSKAEIEARYADFIRRAAT